VDLAALALFQPDQMLRRYFPTAERAMTRKIDEEAGLTRDARLENRSVFTQAKWIR
jgi:hypothetical protein